MKSSPIELISTFRKNILSQTLIILLLLSAMIITSFIFLLQNDPINSVVLTACFVLLLIGYHMYMRSRNLLKMLNPQDPNGTMKAMEQYLKERTASLKSTFIIRLAFGIISALGMVLILYFKPSSSLSGILGVVLVYVVLISMLASWMNMQDAMKLQDLKHCLRNHPSEIS